MTYTPGDMTSQLADGAAFVAEYAGVGAAGAVGLMMLGIGLRKAFQFFGELADGEGSRGLGTGNNAMYDAENAAHEADMRAEGYTEKQINEWRT